MQNEDLLTAEETARLLRLKDVKALYWLNYTRTGPTPRKLGRSLRYRRADVMAFIEGLPTTA